MSTYLGCCKVSHRDWWMERGTTRHHQSAKVLKWLHGKDCARLKGRMQNEALVCSTTERTEQHAARRATTRSSMAYRGYRSPSVYKSILGVA